MLRIYSFTGKDTTLNPTVNQLNTATMVHKIIRNLFKTKKNSSKPAKVTVNMEEPSIQEMVGFNYILVVLRFESFWDRTLRFFWGARNAKYFKK